MNMGKRFLSVVGVLLAAVFCLTVFAACIFSGGDDETDQSETQENVTYKIMYNDGTETHTVEVAYGDVYYITAIPSKEGYVFDGLYDAEIGGTKYVSSSGNALAPFTDKRNIVLFPHFTAKMHIIAFDYGEAQVNGQREIEVAYGEKLGDLPVPEAENKVFAGWFTQPNKQGRQVSDSYGVLPSMAEFNYTNYTPDGNGTVMLYAGFDWADVTVCFVYDGGKTVEQKVAYGTDVDDLDLKLRKDGVQITGWTLTAGSSEIFKGKIEGDIVLYEAQFSPYIDFDAAGGTLASTTIVANAGDSIALPTPQKNGKIFVCWKDASGNVADYKTMPSESVTLFAMWSVEGKLTRYSNHVITDSGRKNQHKDQIVFTDLFGKSLATLKQEGYTGAKFDISIKISEIDDGYQWWFLSRNDTGTDNVDEGYFEHGRGNKDTQSRWHSVSVETGLDSCREIMYMMYGADGWWGDNWNNEALELKITLY